jgi:hypothetical protein
MLARIVTMLTRLVDLFDGNEYRVREDPSPLSLLVLALDGAKRMERSAANLRMV